MKVKAGQAANIPAVFVVGIWSFLFWGTTGDACSIVGYIGNKLCKEFVVKGLSRLEYRGYDSAGFSCLVAPENDLVCIKAEGKLEQLKKKLLSDSLDGKIGIGHTRWATHGAATEANAHPHVDCHHKLAVVHNGIIENYLSLKEQLIREGHQFASQTDTEVLAHLLEDGLQKQLTLDAAVVDMVGKLKGAYAFIAMMKDKPDTLVAVRKSSPLCIGLGAHENFIASDFLAFAGKSNKILFMPDESFAIITKEAIALYDFKGNLLAQEIKTIDMAPASYEKFEHEHFMLKEIYEQPKVIKKTVEYYAAHEQEVWQQLGITPEKIAQLQSIHLFGCGTSWHAARIAQFFFEMICGIPASTHLASEFRYMPFFAPKNSLYIAISQSGETADTLEAIRLIRAHELPVVTLTNVASSTTVRETNGFLLLKAGPEIAVASTKAFTTQMASLYWLAHRIALAKGLITAERMAQAEQELKQAADVLEEAIERHKIDIVQKYAKKYAQAQRFMYLGRHIGYPFAMEGALKLKEISYIFSQGYPAGELKHGSIALVDIETPVVLFSHLDPVIYQKLIANAQEVKARKGHLIVFAFEGQDELIKMADQVFVIGRVAPLLEPIAMAGLMQFFAYSIAKELGCDIDKPRNLAKAVTVE
jgi:glucosamine--fructose-6-phosphate aminotransferase (isomerizing)